MSDYTVSIKPVSNWRLLVRKSCDAGCATVGEFLVALAFAHITPTADDMPEIFRLFTEWRQEHQMIIRGKTYNVQATDD